MTPAPDSPSGCGPLTRRSLLAGSVGVASTLAATGALSSVAAPAADAAQSTPVSPQGAIPPDPVIAYVHDRERGEVTVISGHHEVTYRDPELAARLIAAAPRSTSVVR